MLKNDSFIPPGTVSKEYRRNMYLLMIIGTLFFINPLVLYRFESISANLYLDQWFGFASLWQQNDFGGSVLELVVWIGYFLPDIESIDHRIRWVIGIVLCMGAGWYIWRVCYNVWLAKNSFNNWAIWAVSLKKMLLIGGPTAIIMILLNFFFGIEFSPWNIAEVVSWISLILIGMVVAAGRLWSRDVRRDAGVVGTNSTMGDPDATDHDHADAGA